MNSRITIFRVIVLLATFISCDTTVDPKGEGIEPQKGEKKVSGVIDLPESINPLTLKVLTTSGSYPVAADRRFVSIVNDSLAKQFLFAENGQGEIILAAMTSDSDVTLSSRTTARAILALAPWTGLVDDANLDKILDDAMQLDGYPAFEAAIVTSIEQGVSPLLNDSVIEKLHVLNSQILGIEYNTGGRVAQIPEVDYLVEPDISYSNGRIIINNDGTTTAAWGVEVLTDGMSLTDYLVLPGNKLQFPSLTSLIEGFTGNVEDAVLTSGQPLELPVQIEGKYLILFESPMTLSAGPGREAREYIVFNAARTIIKSFGLDKWGDAIDKQDIRCFQVIVNPLSEVIENFITADRADPAEIVEVFIATYKKTWTEIVKCGIRQGTIKNAGYLDKLSSFFNAYSKVEAVFVLSKLFGDMIVLNDLQVCRQLLGENLYPCFSLVKDEGSDKQVVATGKSVKLLVKTELDYPGDIETYPEGVEIVWKAIKGDGIFLSTSTFTGTDGIADVFYKVGSEEQQLVSASIKDKAGKQLEIVEYELSSQAGAPFLIGCYEVNYAWGDRLLLQVRSNSKHSSYGKVFYYDQVENEWFSPNYDFYAGYSYETDLQVTTRYITVSIDSDGCLSEGFKLYDSDSTKQSFSGTYTDNRCYHEDDLNSAVSLTFLGENYL